MTEEFNPSNPIYLQLAEKINRQIIRNELTAGEKLPSVREMAIISGVNPNTVQRTYSELERMGIVETRRGQGTFVTEDKDILNNIREVLKNRIIESFVKDMREMGYTHDEIIDGLKEFMVNLEKGEKDSD